MPLLGLEPVPGWRFAREVWLRSGLGFLGRTWEKVKKRLGLGGEVEPRRPAPAGSGKGLDLPQGLAPLRRSRCELLDYRERLKFQYFFPLVDQWLKQQEAGLEDTLGSLLGSLSGITAAVHLEETERQARQQRLEPVDSPRSRPSNCASPTPRPEETFGEGARGQWPLPPPPNPIYFIS